ncbi:MAG TPA: hypothetical protein VGI81_00660, partial [Tepidisphaeraceae bacterium]
AAAWYERALPQLEGVVKARAEARVDETARGDLASRLGGSGNWVTLAWSGARWEPAPRSVSATLRGSSLSISNAVAGSVYLVNDRILSTEFAIATTIKGHCLIGLLSADRSDRSVYCTVPSDGAWHDIRLQREGSTVVAYQDGHTTDVKAYNALPKMIGVVGFLIETGQQVEVRSLSIH